MPLFTDGPASTIDDLTRQDSGLLAVSAVEGIDITAKMALAHEEVGLELLSLLQQTYSSANLFSIRSISIKNLVVTPALRLWHTHQTLALVYRDAYYSQLNDRYLGKWKEYRSLAEWAADRLRDTGVGFVLQPVPAAQTPSVVFTPSTEAGGACFLVVSYTNTTGEEGAPCPLVSLDVSPGNALDISVVNPPAIAVGWNLYAGARPDSLFLQNDSPIDMASDWVYYPSAAIVSGTQPGVGQQPGAMRVFPRLLRRG